MNSTHRIRPIVVCVGAAIALTSLGAVLVDVPSAHAAIALELHSHADPEPPPFQPRSGSGAVQ